MAKRSWWGRIFFEDTEDGKSDPVISQMPQPSSPAPASQEVSQPDSRSNQIGASETAAAKPAPSVQAAPAQTPPPQPTAASCRMRLPSLTVEPDEKKTLFRLNRVSKSFFSGGHTVWALREVSIDIPLGGVIGIIGESGSGKTTLLYLLGGLYFPSSGEVLFNHQQRFVDLHGEGFDLDRYRLKCLGWIFQELNLVSHLRIWQNVALPMFLQGWSWPEAKAMTDYYLGKFGLADQANKRPHQLSGGEKQRVAICRALLAEPRVILADEPTGSLDGSNTEFVIKTLRNIADQRHIAVILVTHNLKMARKYCDTIFVCRKTPNFGNEVYLVEDFVREEV